MTKKLKNIILAKYDMETPEIKETFDFLYLHEKQLSSWQSDFIASCKRQFKRDKSLSDRQVGTLRDIRKYLPETVRVTNKI